MTTLNDMLRRADEGDAESMERLLRELTRRGFVDPWALAGAAVARAKAICAEAARILGEHVAVSLDNVSVSGRGVLSVTFRDDIGLTAHSVVDWAVEVDRITDAESLAALCREHVERVRYQPAIPARAMAPRGADMVIIDDPVREMSEANQKRMDRLDTRIDAFSDYLAKYYKRRRKDE